MTPSNLATKPCLTLQLVDCEVTLPNELSLLLLDIVIFIIIIIINIIITNIVIKGKKLM